MSESNADGSSAGRRPAPSDPRAAPAEGHPPGSDRDPRTEYEHRRAARAGVVARLEGREKVISAARLLVFAAGAALNVLINLPGLSDAAYVKTTRKEASDLCDRVTERSNAIYQNVLDNLEKSFEA